jgi:hypothetical protein
MKKSYRNRFKQFVKNDKRQKNTLSANRRYRYYFRFKNTRLALKSYTDGVYKPLSTIIDLNSIVIKHGR